MRKLAILAVCCFLAPLAVLLIARGVEYVRDLPPPRASAPPRSHGQAQWPFPPPPEPLQPEHEPQPPAPPPYIMVVRAGEDQTRILYRDGWTRRETARGFHISAPGGYGYGIGFSVEGGPTSFSLSRVNMPVHEYHRTQQTDTVAGERCTVWTGPQEAEDGGPVSRCITEDGITLWRGGSGRFGNSWYVSERAVSLERQSNAWSRIAPPREVLTWGYWSRYFAAPAASETPAYEIRWNESLQRVRGDFTYSSFSNGGFQMQNPNARLNYGVGRDGYVLLTIEIRSQQPSPGPLSGGSQLMQRAPLHRFGETCRWHRIDLAMRGSVISTCVTADRIALAYAEDFEDPLRADEYNVATYFRRGAPDAALMAPPATLFDPWIAALPN